MNNTLVFNCFKGQFEISDKVIVITFDNCKPLRKTYIHSKSDINELFEMINDIKLRLSHTNDNIDFHVLLGFLINKYDLKWKG